MSMGMSYNDYWYGDVRMTKQVVEANRLRRREENERLWLQGMYIYDGIGRLLSNAFSDKESEMLSYPEKPYPLFEGKKTPKELEGQEEAEERRARAYMLQMDMAFGRKG